MLLTIFMNVLVEFVKNEPETSKEVSNFKASEDERVPLREHRTVS